MSVKLEAKVKAVNAANALALEVAPKLIAAFAPFINKKVASVNGGLLETVKKKLPEVPREPGRFVYVGTGHGYSVSAEVRVHAYVGDVTMSHETVFWICDIDKETGVATKVYEPPTDLRIDYTASEVLDKRVAADAAEKAFDKAKSALHPFGRYDN